MINHDTLLIAQYTEERGTATAIASEWVEWTGEKAQRRTAQEEFRAFVRSFADRGIISEALHDEILAAPAGDKYGDLMEMKDIAQFGPKPGDFLRPRSR